MVWNSKHIGSDSVTHLIKTMTALFLLEDSYSLPAMEHCGTYINCNFMNVLCWYTRLIKTTMSVIPLLMFIKTMFFIGINQVTL